MMTHARLPLHRVYISKTFIGANNNCTKHSKIYFTPRIYKFSKNLGATSKFQAPEGWHVAISVLWTRKCVESPHDLTVIWSFLLGACGLVNIFVCTEKYAIITLKISGATEQNLVARSTWRPAFVHPCFTSIHFSSSTHIFRDY